MDHTTEESNEASQNSAAGPGPDRSAGDDVAYVEKTRLRFVDGQVQLGPDVLEVRAGGKRFTGAIVAIENGRVAQNIGRGTAILHRGSRLNRVPAVGEAVCIMYDRRRGHVVELLVSHDRDMGRAKNHTNGLP
jgi:hypothetical protein